MMFYVGIDVSKQKLDCLWLRDLETLKVKTKVFPNGPDGYSRLEEWLRKTVSSDAASIHIVLEATGVYHEALAYALEAQGFRVSIANPAFVHDFAKGLGSRHKTDKKDSMILARYGALVQPEPWIPEPEEIRVLKALLARLSALEKDLQREVNRREKAEISQSSVAVLNSIVVMIDQLQQEVERVKRQIDDHIDRHPGLKADRDLLSSIPAIAQVMSREMLGVLRSRDFRTAGQVAAFVGLVPKQQESGQWRGRTTLTKNGNGRLRAKLYLAAVVATQHNPDIRAQYRRLLNAGKTKMQAIGAAMRKLVQICYGVLKHQSKYQPQYAI